MVIVEEGNTNFNQGCAIVDEEQVLVDKMIEKLVGDIFKKNSLHCLLMEVNIIKVVA